MNENEISCKRCKSIIAQDMLIGNMAICDCCGHSYNYKKNNNSWLNSKAKKVLIGLGTLTLLSTIFFTLNLTASDEERSKQHLASLSKQEVIKFRNDCQKNANLNCLKVSYERLLQIEPDNIPFQANMAFTLTRLGEHKKAEPIYERILELGEGTYDLMAFYGMTLSSLGKIDESIKWYKNALSINPNLMDTTKDLAISLNKSGQSEQALSLLESFSDNFPTSKAYFKGNIIAIKEKLGADWESRVKKTGQLKLIAIKGGHHFLPLQGSSGVSDSFLIDTGATHVTMSTKQFNELFPDYKGKPSKRKYKIANGDIIEAKMTKVPELKVGPWVLTQVEVSYCDNCAALAGKSLLKNFTINTKPHGRLEYLTLNR